IRDFHVTGVQTCALPILWLAIPLVISVAALYSLLAGFEVPVQRALLMISLGLLIQLLYRQPGLWTFWLIAFAAVVAYNPAAPLRSEARRVGKGGWAGWPR